MKRPDCTDGASLAAGLTHAQWAAFLHRHDPIWEVLPQSWEHGAFIGDGLLGAMFHLAGEGENRRLIGEIGRADVYDPRPDPVKLDHDGDAGLRKRLLIGQFHLVTQAPIRDGSIRLDLWNAELVGHLRTGDGEIRWRAWAPRGHDVIAIAWTGFEGERDCRMEWRPHPGVYPTRHNRPLPQANPPGHAADDTNAVAAWVQPFAPGGDVVTAWTEIPSPEKRVLLISVGYAPKAGSALEPARRTVQQAAAQGSEALTDTHRAWWHAYYPASFLTVPDTRLEGFYYIQLYKMGSATRPDAPAMDLLGPWLRPDCNSPAAWWNLNSQVAYWMHLAANQLHLGEALTNSVERNIPSFIANAPAEYRADGAFLGNPCCPEMRNSRFNVTTAGLARGEEKTAPSILCLPWLMHNVFLQYRYSMDDALLRRMFDLLRRTINLPLRLLVEGQDGRLHLPDTYVDEYGIASDATQDLAFIRWGCRTLLWSCERLGLDDPLIPRWREVLERLVDYHQDANGWMLGDGMPMAISHRHFGQLFPFYPLFEITPDTPENEALIRRTLDHWLTVPILRLDYEFAGWSWCAAAGMRACLGDGIEALRLLHLFLDNYVYPNTLYAEGHNGRTVTIETPLMAGRSLQEMLLQSWGDVIRVFPAVPAEWAEAAFHQLRAEGAFLVSAARRDGATSWVQITSLAGEPCRVHLGMNGPIWTDGPPGLTLDFPGGGVIKINLKTGQSVLFFSGNERPDLKIDPLPCHTDPLNTFGLKQGYQAPFFMRPV